MRIMCWCSFWRETMDIYNGSMFRTSKVTINVKLNYQDALNVRTGCIMTTGVETNTLSKLYGPTPDLSFQE